VHGIVPPKNDPRFSQPQNTMLCWGGKASIVLFPAILALVAGLGVFQFLWMFGVSFSTCDKAPWVCWAFKEPGPHLAALRAIGFFCYVWTLSIVATRF
jgi:hypothetical protein